MFSVLRSQTLQLILFSRLNHRLLILFGSFLAAVTGLMAPLFQKHFTDSLLGHSSFDFLGNLHPMSALGISLLLLLSYYALNLFTSYWGLKESVWMQRRLGEDLYQKTVELRGDSVQGKQIGEIVSLYATDVPGATVLLEQSLPSGLSIVFPLVLAPLFIHYFYHISVTGIVVIITTLVLVNLILARRQSVFFARFKSLAAERLGIVNEWIQNIRTLRILGWVDEFERRIFETREKETINRISMVTNGQSMNAISTTVTFIMNIVAIIGLTQFSNEPLTPGTLLSLLWIIAIFLQRPFRHLPWFFTFVFDGWTSITRLDEFYQLKNIWPEEKETAKSKNSNYVLEVQGLNLQYQDAVVLKDLDIHLSPGEFVTVVGEVGSGKTMLLLSLLRETKASFKKMSIYGKPSQQFSLADWKSQFSYVPQEGFIMSSDLRDNVAFEYDTEKELDTDILQNLKNAQFGPDLDHMPQLLDTPIGERGVNLSGGQKQRVSLARVDHFKRPIILLDDCVSAIDVDTEKKLIESLIAGSLKNTTRLMVTHRLSVLQKSDRVLFMKDGSIIAEGPYLDLLSKSEDFRLFVKTTLDAEVSQPKELRVPHE